MPFETVPLARDSDAAVRLVRAAVYGNPWIGENADAVATQAEAAIRSGDRTGALLTDEGGPIGLVLWERRPGGAAVHVAYLEPGRASAETLTALIDGARRLAGPVATVPGEFASISPAVEEATMTRLGFHRFGRMEMQWDPETRLEASDPGRLPPVRAVSAADLPELSRLHAAAYRGRFDRFLFLTLEDEEEDSVHLTRELLGGRWGEFAPEGSRGVEEGGQLVGAVISVQRGPGALVGDVMVDPAAQGRGVGRLVLTASLVGLREAGRLPVVLNVTVGNARAERLYARLGFTRSLGPSRDWYDPRVVPASPYDPDGSRASGGGR